MSSGNEPNDHWPGDILNRRADAHVIFSFLAQRVEERAKRSEVGSYVLNIDAEWGSGKTYFLTRLREQLRSNGHCCVYVNAWEDDHADAPLIALMAAVDEEIGRTYPRSAKISSAWESAKEAAVPLLKTAALGAVKTAAKKVFGSEGFEELISIAKDGATSQEPGSPSVAGEITKGALEGAIDSLGASDASRAIDQFTSKKALLKKFREKLSDLAGSFKNGGEDPQKLFFVLVDELDRCRPSYSVSLLEDIKHLFSVEGLIFIVATDTAQLSSSIRSIYGEGFDAQRYLLRFFDRTYRFAKPSTVRFVEHLCSRYAISEERLAWPPDKKLYEAIAIIFEDFSLSLRDIEQCMDMLASAITLWDAKAKLNLIYLTFMVVAHHSGDTKLFSCIAECDFANFQKDFGKRFPDQGTRFAFGGRQDFGRGNSRDEVTATRLLDQFLRNYSLEMDKFFEDENPSAASARWAHTIVAQEYQDTYGGTVARDKRLLVRKYVTLVQNAGRLLRTEA
ncbi:MAG: hypothetical protein IOC86_02485 [Aestuariivirga sp.]|nr:hypothetical protein [Aestuariivirga sp.]